MTAKTKSRMVKGSFALVIFLGLAFQNCSGGFRAMTSSLTGKAVDDSTASNSTTVDPVTGLQVIDVPALCQPMRTVTRPDLLRPVLATRNMGCISCHAQINGDLVTDFGYGDPFFMGSDDPKNHPKQADTWGPFFSKHFVYGQRTWAETWDGTTNQWDPSGTAIMGNVYVPDATITDKKVIAAYTNAGHVVSGSLKLVDLLKNTMVIPDVPDTTPRYMISASTSTDINVAGLRGSFISRSSIWIDSPSQQEIRELLEAPTTTAYYAGLGLVIKTGSKDDRLSGLGSKESTKTHKLYAENTGPMTCYGDVIIDGVLLLNNAQIATDSKGCRMYVTGSVFIQGPVTYTNGGNSNLQITSSLGIIMGMRSLNLRLSQDNDQNIVDGVGGIRNYPTDDTELGFNAQIMTDRDSVDELTDDAGPTMVMTDAANNVLAYQTDSDNDVWVNAPGINGTQTPSSCPACAVNWAGSYMRKTVKYTHMVLNAPQIHSRYYGTFTGVIIAENVLFAIGQFSFQNDPVLTKVDLLPLVGDRIFSMSSQ